TGGEISVLAFLKQRADHNLRIATRFYAYKPAVIFELLLAKGPEARFGRVADGLSAAGLSGEVNALEMRAGCGADGIHHVRHRVGNDLPVLRIDRNFQLVRHS